MNFSELKAFIQKERHDLLLYARSLATAFEQANKVAMESRDPNSQCYIGTRVRLINKSISCEWYRKNFRPNKKDPLGKRVMQSTYIRLNRQKGRYPEKLFASQPLWSQVIYQNIEKQYALIRKQSKVLTSLERLCESYEQNTKTLK